jgi:putative chitinase
MITVQNLKKIAPNIKQAPLSIYPELLNQIMPKYEINNKGRVAAFVAQILHESGEFKWLRELASGNAYEGREDLGNKYPGDGKKFKGRGLIQVTGRGNYAKCSEALFGDHRLTTNPDILATPQYAVESACWFWKSKGLNEIADMPEDWIKIVKSDVSKDRSYTKQQYICRKINGGFNGLAEREAYYERALKEL